MEWYLDWPLYALLGMSAIAEFLVTADYVVNTYHHLRFPHSRLRGFFYAPPYHIPYVILFFL